MKYILIIGLVLLSGCVVEDNSEHGKDLYTICLDGVAYWYDAGYSGQMMAPRIDPNTLTFVLCKEKQ